MKPELNRSLDLILSSCPWPDTTRSVEWITDLLTLLEVIHLSGKAHGGLCLQILLIDGENRLTISSKHPNKVEVSDVAFSPVAFQSPEQSAGIMIDQRSDIYSVGIIFYLLLTGRHPYQCQNSFEMTLAHIELAPAPFAPDSPAAVLKYEATLRRALSKDPDSRFGNCRDFAQSLELSGWTDDDQQNTASSPDTAESSKTNNESVERYQTKYWNKRLFLEWRWTIISLTTLLPLIIGLTIVFGSQIFRSESVVARSDSSQISGRTLTRPAQLTAEYLDLLRSSGMDQHWSCANRPHLTPIEKTDLTGGQLAVLITQMICHNNERAIQLAREQTLHSNDEGLWYDLLGNALFQAERTDEAINSWQAAVQYSTDEAERNIRLGNIAFARKEWNAAENSYRLAFTHIPTYPFLACRLARSSSELGLIHLNDDNDEMAVEKLKYAIQVDDTVYEYHLNLAKGLFNLDRHEEAKESIRKAQRLKDDCAVCFYDLGYINFDQGYFDEARTCLMNALKIDPAYSDAKDLLDRIDHQISQTTESGDKPDGRPTRSSREKDIELLPKQ